MTFRELWQPLTPLYGDGEAKAIARMVLEQRFGLTMTDIVGGALEHLLGANASEHLNARIGANASERLNAHIGANASERLKSPMDLSELYTCFDRLRKGEPVQYVLGTANFCGRNFEVSPQVLIPRPETAQLCQMIIEALSPHTSHLTPHTSHLTPHTSHLLDIGTGSGCIAITLALEIANSRVVAWDISEAALEVARANAQRLGANVEFEQRDILQSDPLQRSEALPPTEFDIIVSNPPYVCQKEQATMHPNVLHHEPHIALFVPDDDPLLFYRHIARLARQSLFPNGSLYLEINPIYSEELKAMLEGEGLVNVAIKPDNDGHQRFAIAHQPQ